MNATSAAPPVAVARPSEDAEARPRFWRTYALTYALGAIWVAVEIALIGTQPSYGFTPVYVTAFMLPPFLAIAGLLVALGLFIGYEAALRIVTPETPAPGRSRSSSTSSPRTAGRPTSARRSSSTTSWSPRPTSTPARTS